MTQNRQLKTAAGICRIVLAATFIVSGFVKVIDPWGTAIKINEYLAIYGFENLSRLRFGFSIWLCGAELMMGCMLLFRIRIRLISIFALASMTFFTLLTFLSATWLPVEDCGCFGDAIKLSPGQTFFKNLVLLPLSIVVWYRYRHDRIFAFNRIEMFCTILIFGFSMGLGIWCYRHLPPIDFRPFKIGVNIHRAMNDTVTLSHASQELRTVLVYRNRQTGKIREFSLDDTRWQNSERWEWVDTRTEGEAQPAIDPTLSEFALRDPEGDATEQLLTRPGRVYWLCVTDFDRLPSACAERFARIVARAEREHAEVYCLTPEPLHEPQWRSFAGSVAVRCYNIDATTLKTMLRAMNGMVVLENGTIVDKRNCRDIR